MYEDANKGLRIYFYASIGTYICFALLFVRLFLTISIVGLLLLSIAKLFGLWKAGNEFDGYRTAFWLNISYFIFAVFARVLNSFYPTKTLIISLLGAFLLYMCFFKTYDSTNQLLSRSEMISDELINMGKIAIKLCLGEAIISVLISLLSIFKGISIIFIIIYYILAIAFRIVFMRYIYKSMILFGKTCSLSDGETAEC
jgi:hypothetical protein